MRFDAIGPMGLPMMPAAPGGGGAMQRFNVTPQRGAGREPTAGAGAGGPMPPQGAARFPVMRPPPRMARGPGGY